MFQPECVFATESRVHRCLGAGASQQLHGMDAETGICPISVCRLVPPRRDSRLIGTRCSSHVPAIPSPCFFRNGFISLRPISPHLHPDPTPERLQTAQKSLETVVAQWTRSVNATSSSNRL